MDTYQGEQHPQHAETKKQHQKRSFWAACGRYFIYILILSVFLALLAMGGIAYLLYQDPVALSKKVSEEIYARTGMQMQFSQLDIALLPVPSLILHKVHAQHADISFSMAEISVSPSLLDVVQGDIIIDSMVLVKPHIEGSMPALKQETRAPEHTPEQRVDLEFSLKEYLHATIKRHTVNLPLSLQGSSIAIREGTVRLVHGQERIMADDLSVEVTFGKSAMTDNVNTLTIAIESSASHVRTESVDDLKSPEHPLTLEKDTRTSFDNIHVATQLQFVTNNSPHEAQAWQLHTAHADVETDIHVTDIVQKTHFAATIDLDFHSSRVQDQDDTALATIQWATRGDFLWHKAPITFAISGKAAMSGEDDLRLESVDIGLENDRLILNGLLKDVTSAPSLQGVLDIERVSLTQWFGFARILPPGLRYSLNDIRGSLAFTLDEHSLDVPHIDARAAEAHFLGRGGVASWDDVVIFLDVTTPQVALLHAFSEAEGVDAPVITFHHEPLTPIPGTPEAINLPGPTINYDINVNADKVDVWSLRVGGVRFRCLPAADVTKGDNAKDKTLTKLPKNTPKNSVLMAFRVADLYGGRADGDLWLYPLQTKNAEKNDTGYSIRAAVRHVRIEEILSRFRNDPGLQPIGGRLYIDTFFTAKGQHLNEFLLSHKGHMAARVEKGFLARENKKFQNFETLQLDATLQSNAVTAAVPGTLPDILRYNGQWHMDLKAQDLDVKTRLKGNISFSGEDYATIKFDRLSGTIDTALAAPMSPIKRAFSPSIDGSFSLNTKNKVFQVHSADMRLPELSNLVITGSGALHFAKELRFIGALECRTKTLSSVLHSLFQGKKEAYLPNAPQDAHLKAQVEFAKSELVLDEIVAAWGDDLAVQGKIQGSFEKKPLWNIALKGTMLDWDALFPSDTTEKRPPTKPWSWKWLNDFDAQGTVDLDMLRISRIAFTKVHIPIRIQQGRLSCTSTFALYGGTGEATFAGLLAENALNAQGGLTITQMQLPLMSASQQLPTLIGGTGNAWFSVQGKLQNAADALHVLEGTWRIKLLDGFLQERHEDGSLKDSMTRFDSVEDAGTLSNGILKSNNFQVKGPDMTVSGNGTVNFVNKTLDIRWLVSSSGFSDIPVRFHGDMNNPQREIGTGAVIMQAILGVFGIFGSFVTGFFELFQ